MPIKEKTITETPSVNDTTRVATNSGDDRGNTDNRSRGRRPGGHNAGGRREKPKSEFANKILAIRRVTRVMAGGRRFSFSVAIVIGDKKGRVGVGIGKASDTALAIEKATNDAKRNMITVPLTKESSIRHEIAAKYNAARITIAPSVGRGMVAGSAVRIVLDHAGVKDVNAKILSRSKNKLNIGRATIEALKTLNK
ncbi:MAG TPA: 30S ribosomal protein S5 [Candidatus Paceibacterota bacterium]|nr:small subunit ribosomal protein [Patescibacteria group bacterium]